MNVGISFLICLSSIITFKESFRPQSRDLPDKNGQVPPLWILPSGWNDNKVYFCGDSSLFISICIKYLINLKNPHSLRLQRMTVPWAILYRCRTMSNIYGV